MLKLVEQTNETDTEFHVEKKPTLCKGSNGIMKLKWRVVLKLVLMFKMLLNYKRICTQRVE